MANAAEVAAIGGTTVRIHLVTDRLEPCRLKAQGQAAATCEQVERGKRRGYITRECGS